MRRSERLDAVQRALDDEQQLLAKRVAQYRGSMQLAHNKLLELERYCAEYSAEYRRQVAQGLAGVRLRDYQAFLAKLQLALRQQQEALTRARTEFDYEQQRWQLAAGQAAAVSGVVQRWRSEEQNIEDRREQRLSDDNASRRQFDRH
jgi:flagellar FliJ protein